MIYVIGTEGSTIVKIGHGNRPGKRLSTLQTGNPVELKLLWTCDGDSPLEGHLHHVFRTYRIRGEWFDLAPLGDPVAAVQAAVAEAVIQPVEVPSSGREAAGKRAPATPMYTKVASDLSGRIDTGEFPVGSKLPGIIELMAHYQVSKATVSDALKALASEGRIVSRRRQGSTVLAPKTSATTSFGYSPEGGLYGPPGEVRTDAAERACAPEDVASALGVGLGDPVIFERQVTVGGDETVALQHSWRLIPERYDGDVASDVLGTRLATPDEARLFAVAPRTPVLTVQRTIRADNDRVVEVLRISYPADRVSAHYRTRRSA